MRLKYKCNFFKVLVAMQEFLYLLLIDNLTYFAFAKCR